MAVVGASLAGVTSTGPGTAVVSSTPPTFCTAQVTVSGAVNISPTIAFEFSLDMTNWGQVMRQSFNNGTTIVNVSSGMAFVAARANYLQLGDGATTVSVVLDVA